MHPQYPTSTLTDNPTLVTNHTNDTYTGATSSRDDQQQASGYELGS